MHRLTLFLLAVWAWGAVAAPAEAHQPGATVAPAMPGVRGQNPMDPHPATMDIPPLAADYTLTARVSERRADGTVRVDGTARIALKNIGPSPVERPTFNTPAAHYGWFGLESGTLDGTPAAVDQADVRFTFPDWSPLPPGGTRVVGFVFHLDIRDAGDGYDSCRLDGDILRLAYWFPMLSDDHGFTDRIDPVYTATSDFHVSLSAPAGTIMAATGATTKEETAAGRVTYTAEAAKVRDWVALLSPAYVVLKGQTAGGVIVQLYTVPAHYERTPGRAEAVLAAAITSIERMSAWVGPYPYPVFSVADAGLTMPGGVEFPTLIMIGSRINDYRTLVAHETAHQWFYGILGTHTQTEPWVDEGAASYFEQAIWQSLIIAPVVPRPLPCAVSVSVWDDRVSNANANYCAYTGGRKVYAVIAATLGPERFPKALRELYTTYDYGIISARDLLTVFQKNSPADLRPMLRMYLDYPWLDQLPPPGG